MERNRFHIRALLMTCVVQSLACEPGLQEMFFAFGPDSYLARPQQESVRVFEINKLLQKIEEQHFNVIVRKLNLPDLTRLDRVEIIYHHVHRRIRRSYEQFG